MKNVLTTLLLFFSLLCYGQSSKLFTTDNELSSSLINQIYQDRNGFIWVATEDGLNRYDGAKFTIYKHDPNNEHSLAHSFVRTVFEDSKGHLLIGTYIGIQMYNPDTDDFTPLARREDNGEIFESNIVSIIERKNGDIWISGNVLCKLYIKDNQLIVQQINASIASPGYMKKKNRISGCPKERKGYIDLIRTISFRYTYLKTTAISTVFVKIHKAIFM